MGRFALPHNIILHFLWHYGYIVLFAALFLELIALPIPGEFLMTYAGFMVFQNQLHWGLSILIAGLGSICGISSAYWIGSKLGRPFFEKYGHYIHLGPDKLQKASAWFTKYGNWVLAFAYFVPGLRHLTGYFSGVSRIPFRQFVLHAYLGAFFWAATFISLGKVLGPKWERFHGPIRIYLLIGCLILIIVGTLVYVYQNYRSAIYQFLLNLINRTAVALHSLKRAKVILSVTLVFFLSLAYLSVRFIKVFLANEFKQFNRVSLSVLKLIFVGHWETVIRSFGVLASFPVLLLVIALAFVWIWVKGKDRFLESISLATVTGGGLILEEVLQLVFDRLTPLDVPIRHIIHQFPSEKTLIIIAVYGFAAFLLVRHAKKIWLKTLASPLVIAIVTLTGINQVFFHIQNPSDVLAGLMFGGVWLSFNVLLFEIFQALRQDNFQNRLWVE